MYLYHLSQEQSEIISIPSNIVPLLGFLYLLSTMIECYSNNKPHDPHSFKAKAKVKYDTVKAITGKFPNVTAAMMTLLAAAVPPIYWIGYCALTPDKQLVLN